MHNRAYFQAPIQSNLTSDLQTPAFNKFYSTGVTPIKGFNSSTPAQQLSQKENSNLEPSKNRKMNKFNPLSNHYYGNSQIRNYTNFPQKLNSNLSSNNVALNNKPINIFQRENVRNNGHSLIAKNRNNYFDGGTGENEQTKLKNRKMERNSLGKMRQKSKNKGERIIVDNGSNLIVLERHREGGVIGNIKDAFNHILRR